MTEFGQAIQNADFAGMKTWKSKWKSIRDKISKLDPLSEEVSIFRVPDKLRNVDKEAYSPCIVSIGPFHYSNDVVAAMSEHKWRYLQYFFQRTEDPPESRKCMKECTKAIIGLDAEVRRSYAEKISWDVHDLGEMMLLDGCFTLELLLRYEQHLNMSLGDKSDPIFHNDWMLPDLRHDLVLLENQIPFFILNLLYESVKPCLKTKPPNSITSLALKVFKPVSEKAIEEEPGIECKHLLDLLYKFYFVPDSNSVSIPLTTDSIVTENQHLPTAQPISCRSKSDPESNETLGFEYGASKVFHVGKVGFARGSTKDHLPKITRSAGAITIPPVFFNETTNSLFRNLIAFEQCNLSSTQRVIQYAILMKSLIQSRNDFELLRKRGIINDNGIGDLEYYTQFKTIADEVVVKDSCFGKLCEEVNAIVDRNGKSNSTTKSREELQESQAKWMEEIIENLRKVDPIYFIFYPETNIVVKGEFCIYKVPDKLRQGREDAYRPRAVSIGPWHNNVDNLESMVQYKLSYMVSLLQQKVAQDHFNLEEYREYDQRAKKCLQDCTDAIYGLDYQVVRQCYTEVINYTDDELARIFVLDGCFILELFLRFDRSLKYINLEDCKSDIFFKSDWMMAALQHDLALLENQIPFFILELLYEAIKPHVTKCKLPKSVTSLALKFFQPASVGLKRIKEPAENSEFKHLLDLLHQFYFLPVPSSDVSIKIDRTSRSESEQHLSEVQPGISDSASTTKWGLDQCASELLKSGVELKGTESTDYNLLNITFENGVIRIPQLHIHETTSSLFRNQIAYEQCSLRSQPAVTSYCFLMKSLIRSPEDIKLLERENIIKHNRIGEQEYLTQFKNILDDVVVGKDDFCFGPLCDQVNAYRKTWYNWSRIKVILRVQTQRQGRILYTTYFNTTWKVISLLAAATLLILTSIQTHYTIHPRH